MIGSAQNRSFPMKRAAVSAAIFCVAAVAAQQSSTVNNSRSNIKNNIAFSQGRDGKLKCSDAEGKPCTEEQVKQLSATFNTGKSGIKNLALAGPDGSVKCEMMDGKPCAAAQLPELNRSVAAMGIATTPEPSLQRQVQVNNSRSNIKNNLAVSQGSDGNLKCIGPDSKPCTQDQVKQLLAAVKANKSNIKDLALAGPDGTLKCATKDGKPCTGAHLTELNDAAAAMPARPVK
jgi:hypothetical protein